MLHAGEPEGRLPDAGLALEHERSQPSPCFADERVEGAQFLLPADYLEHRPDRDRDRRQRNLDLGLTRDGAQHSRRDLVPPTPTPAVTTNECGGQISTSSAWAKHASSAKVSTRTKSVSTRTKSLGRARPILRGWRLRQGLEERGRGGRAGARD